jgi:hypothetical protein
MDDVQPAPVNPGRLIDASKLSWEERAQLRAIILKARAPELIADQTSSESE